MRIYHSGRQEDMDIPEEHLFLGKCKGIALVPRGKNDPHICLLALAEDDGLWFASGNAFSSFWADDLEKSLARATNWMKTHADKDPSGYGYVFRSSL